MAICKIYCIYLFFNLQVQKWPLVFLEADADSGPQCGLDSPHVKCAKTKLKKGGRPLSQHATHDKFLPGGSKDGSSGGACALSSAQMCVW